MIDFPEPQTPVENLFFACAAIVVFGDYGFTEEHILNMFSDIMTRHEREVKENGDVLLVIHSTFYNATVSVPKSKKLYSVVLTMQKSTVFKEMVDYSRFFYLSLSEPGEKGVKCKWNPGLLFGPTLTIEQFDNNYRKATISLFGYPGSKIAHFRQDN